MRPWRLIAIRRRSARGGSRRIRLLYCGILFLLAAVYAPAQITDAESGCELIEAVESTLPSPGDMILSLERCSEERGAWLYEAETSSGAKLLIGPDGEIQEELRAPVRRSRKQLEREAAARAIREERIPSLCALLREHYRRHPGSQLLELCVEYDHGEFEGELSFLDPSRGYREFETEWERDDWERED